jgi:GAF domain-containing protein
MTSGAKSGQPRSAARRALSWAVVGVTTFAGIVALATSLPGLPADRLPELGLFILVCAACQRMPVALFRNSSISVAFAVAFAALVYMGPAAATWVQVGAGLVLCVTPYVKPPQKMLFNLTSLPLETALAGLVYVALGGVVAPGYLGWSLLPPALVAITVFVLANTIGLTVVIALETGSSLAAIWTLNYRWLLPNYVGLGLVGLGMAIAVQTIGLIGLAVFLLPLGMAWYSFKLYMAQTAEVRRRNQELQLTNAQLDLANSRLNQRVTELATLNKVGLSLNGSLDLGDVLGEILDSTLKLVPAQATAVALCDPASQQLSIGASIGLPPGADRALLAADGPARRAYEGGVEVVLDSADTVGALVGTGVQAVVALPLRFNGSLGGVFLVTFATARDVGVDERLLLSTLAQQAATAVHNARLYQEIEQGYLSTIQALVQVTDARERYQPGHAERVRAYAVATGRRLGLDDRQLATLELAALFHDLGHVGVPEAALGKDGALTAEEWAMVRRHPLLGVAILRRVPRLEAVAPVILQHHERYDGQGYPAGLLGDDTSPLAQVLAVADAYEAMTSARPHRAALSRSEAVAELRKNSGTQFAPRAVEALLAAVAVGVSVQEAGAAMQLQLLARGATGVG